MSTPSLAMSARCTVLLLAAGLIGAAPAALAVEGVSTPGLTRAVEAAWQRASEARHAEGESVRADFDRRIARSLAADNPSASFSREEGDWYRGARAGSGTETELRLNWPLWMPGQRRAAMQAARADVDWAQANLAVARLEVAGKVREAAWDVASRQAEHDLVEVRVGFLKKLADDVARRVDAGDLARSDLLAAQADLFAAQAELADSERVLHASHTNWRVLTGLDELPDAKEIENESHVDIAALLAAAGTPPAVTAAEQMVQRAEGGLTASRRSLGAPPELSLGVKDERDGPDGPGDRSLMAELTVPLGVGARRSKVRAQAQTELDVAQAELVLARSRHEAELENAKLAIDLADAQLENESKRAGLLAERVRLMQRAFSAGEIALSDLLSSNRNSAEAEAALARRHAEHGLAHARLLQVIGKLP